MGKNVAVFVDVANIFYAAKAAGVDIDYVTLLKTASAGRDLVRAYAYTGLDPENENQRNFHDFLRRHGYKVVSKDIRKYGDGKVKANLDIELVVDMMKTARNLDIAIVISGDGDFAPAIRAVQEMGVRVEVISFRGNTSSDLIEVADQFTEITQVARVEKGSSRSGRRVADDDEDLSMTEVPDKQSEGTGARGRGRGRGRSRVAEVEPVAAPARSRGRSRVAATAEPAAVTSDGTPLVVLPGEKLSRVAATAAPVAVDVAADDDTFGEVDLEADGDAASGSEAGGDEPRRRRRRRGGRGRGRGRGAEEGLTPVAGAGSDEGREAIAADAVDEDEEEASDAAPAPAKRAAHAFGSVWDSQIGMPTSATGGRTPLADDEDLDEPPIPEYLIAERRQRDSGRGGAGRGGRGARGAYAAALDRERFGGGRGATTSRFAEPAPRGGRGDDRPRDDRFRGGRGQDRPRGDRPIPRPPARSGSGDEPWSEVPPEIEAMLRAQLGGRAAAPARPAPVMPAEPVEAPAPDDSEAPRRRTGRTTAGRAGTRRKVEASSPAADVAPVAAGDAPAPAAEAAAPKRRTTRKAASPAAQAGEAPAPAAEVAAPKRRTTRKPATAATEAAALAEAAAPKRRTTRKKADAPDA
ncbi:MAG: NYN domain-containing protein [Chloroflexi bacterium]|nr:NYN domain-containing protein [Chloroflexota bacterium]